MLLAEAKNVALFASVYVDPEDAEAVTDACDFLNDTFRGFTFYIERRGTYEVIFHVEDRPHAIT